MNQETNDVGGAASIEPEDQLPDFTFDDLSGLMHENALALGWTTPMPVQTKAIPYLMSERDMIVQSHTGSGKTGAFLIPLIQMINPAGRYPQALILVPTRELASQVYREFEALSAGMGLRGALIYGGVGYGPQLDALHGGAQIIIGTPGRILDHLGRRSMSLRDLRIVIFDEADEMLSMGFYPAMREVRTYLPRERLSWMFSATIPYKVQLLSEEFLSNPGFLSLSAGHESVNTMEHRYYQVPPMDKDLMLMRLIEIESPESAIIFCNTKSEVEYLVTALRNHGYNADQISGDLSQKEREAAMSRIRTRETRFLVATDVAARGIDISDLAFVFQYDIPKDTESYLHRAGRTARAGNTGVVVTLIANISEKTDLKKIARKYNVDFVEMPLPSEEEVESRIAERLINLLEDRFRTSSTRGQRERMKRFEPLVKSLSETDDEWMLVAMLFDEIYQREFHATPASVEGPHGRDKEVRRDEARREEARRQEGRRHEERRDDGRRQEGRREEDRRDEGRRQEKRRDEPRHDEKPRESQPVQDAGRPNGIPEDQGEADGEVRKKKKRRRKRKRNRDRRDENVVETTPQSVEGGEEGETDGDSSVSWEESVPDSDQMAASDTISSSSDDESSEIPVAVEPQRPRSSGSRRRGTESAQLSEAIVPEKEPSIEVVALEPSKSPKQKRSRKSSDVSEEAVAAAPPQERLPQEKPAKSKRTSKKNDAETTEVSVAVAESAAKPKRSAKKKADESATSETAVAETESTSTPKRSARKKKSEDAAATPTGISEVSTDSSDVLAKPKARRKKSDK